jgi:hypothetical protein
MKHDMSLSPSLVHVGATSLTTVDDELEQPYPDFNVIRQHYQSGISFVTGTQDELGAMPLCFLLALPPIVWLPPCWEGTPECTRPWDTDHALRCMDLVWRAPIHRQRPLIRTAPPPRDH